MHTCFAIGLSYNTVAPVASATFKYARIALRFEIENLHTRKDCSCNQKNRRHHLRCDLSIEKMILDSRGDNPIYTSTRRKGFKVDHRIRNLPTKIEISPQCPK